MQNIEEITGLIVKHLRQELSPDEATQLQNWVDSSKVNQQYFNDINNIPDLMSIVHAYESAGKIDLIQAWNNMKAVGWEAQSSEEIAKLKYLNFGWKSWVAIAASLLLLGFGAYLRFIPKKKPVQITETKVEIPSDVKPNIKNAILTLDDGRTIVLDSVKNGLLVSQGAAQIVKSGTTISYNASKTLSSGASIYNTVSVPRGGNVIDLELSDGSRVWLNAASSIRYPVTFNSDQRRVEITGEAYFEVVHKEDSKPFIVSKENLDVTVLGTHFNVNAYEDDGSIRVTLLEGSVKVTIPQLAHVQKMLKPGQQAISLNGKLDVDKDVDTDQVLAWKNGKFAFNKTNIQLIMKQIERWYDVETVYESDIVKKLPFSGEISRYNTASKVLDLLGKTGFIRFRIVGKKVFVSQP
ncbi:FecR domain-containing protein [Niastella sp. OAS944]|uniref:FecR family protein n=1 Tax=Niastella sp. OAS944 TaxID=2664089 RepID=UPI00349A4031|nr:hypothetical protein [Chitinophagaceae bacterium OAS944]